MSFWLTENHPSEAVACYCEKEKKEFSYGELTEASTRFSERLPGSPKHLFLLLCDNSWQTVVAYLGTLRSGHAAMLLPWQTDTRLLSTIVNYYSPEFIWDCSGGDRFFEGYKHNDQEIMGSLYHRVKEDRPGPLHQDLAVLLSTSGTTGSPKFVRLSYGNIQSNAEAISEYMAISTADAAITSLPFSYSYGLSVINSHLLMGAKIVCSNGSIVTGGLWKLFREQQCTFFAGVPFTFETLLKLHFERMELPSLRIMTQAGGRMNKETIKKFYDLSKEKQFQLFIMYGQTEATARISYVPPAKLGKKIGSIGVPIPGGSMAVVTNGMPHDDSEIEGELFYQGPNVMLGYAESRPDLGIGDTLNGELKTGDLGYKDTDGFYYVTGRLKRFVKIYGLRINLDEVERMIESHGIRNVACIGEDDILIILISSDDSAGAESVKQKVVDIYKLHHSVVEIKVIDKLLVTGSGKKDYEAMKRAYDNVRS